MGDINAVNFFTGFTICIGMLVVLTVLVAMCFKAWLFRKKG